MARPRDTVPTLPARTWAWVTTLGRAGGRLLGPALVVLLAGTAAAQSPGTPAPPLSTAPASGTVDTRDFERLLRGLDTDEARLARELEAIGPKRDVVRARMIARGRAYYRLVRAGLLPVGGGFDALVDHATRVERLRTSIERDLDLLGALDERAVELDKELRRIRAEKAPLEVQRQALERARVAMRQADERAEAYERAFGAEGSSPSMAIYGPSSVAPSEPVTAAGPFAAMRGRLSFPLGGRAEVVDGGASAGPGLELRAAHDTPVRAVYAGRVVFVGEYLDYGMSVLIDHGDEFFSLYGRLSRAEVDTGDAVPDRGRVGWVGRGSPGAAVLHFELRKGSAPLDAHRWLGL